MKYFLLLGLMILNTAMAEDSDVGVLIQPQEYASMDAAATSGLKKSFELSNRYEYGGVVYKKIGSDVYFISTPSTLFHRMDVNYPSPNVDGYLLVAEYHTHPCISGSEDWAQYFSEEDQYSASAQHIYGYMSDMCTGKVHKMASDSPVASLKPPPLWKEKEVKLNVTHQSTFNPLLNIDLNVWCSDELTKKVKGTQVQIEYAERVMNMSCKEFKHRMLAHHHHD